jgi:hypothetical protein
VPACFASEDACKTNTNGCSGHGACVNKWAIRKDEEEERKRDEKPPRECWACRCLKETATGTTHFGGAMCEKIDISVPTAMFVGVVIFLVTMVAGAISLLVQVGNAPMPSILGAGGAAKK